MSWEVTKDKQGIYHVKASKKGRYSTKKSAFEAAKKLAMADKALLRIHNEKGGYEVYDFTNTLSPKEWLSKADSDYKVAKAEYMISKTRYLDAWRDVNWAKILKRTELPSFTLFRKKLEDASNRKARTKLAYKQAKRRLNIAKKNCR